MPLLLFYTFIVMHFSHAESSLVMSDERGNIVVKYKL